MTESQNAATSYPVQSVARSMSIAASNAKKVHALSCEATVMRILTFG